MYNNLKHKTSFIDTRNQCNNKYNMFENHQNNQFTCQVFKMFNISNHPKPLLLPFLLHKDTNIYRCLRFNKYCKNNFINTYFYRTINLNTIYLINIDYKLLRNNFKPRKKNLSNWGGELTTQGIIKYRNSFSIKINYLSSNFFFLL